jgi:hypothetical protein
MFCLRSIKIGRCAPSSTSSYSRGGRKRRRRRRRGPDAERSRQLHSHQEDQRDLRPPRQGPVLQVRQGKGNSQVVVALLRHNRADGRILQTIIYITGDSPKGFCISKVPPLTPAVNLPSLSPRDQWKSRERYDMYQWRCYMPPVSTTCTPVVNLPRCQLPRWSSCRRCCWPLWCPFNWKFSQIFEK